MHLLYTINSSFMVKSIIKTNIIQSLLWKQRNYFLAIFLKFISFVPQYYYSIPTNTTQIYASVETYVNILSARFPITC